MTDAPDLKKLQSWGRRAWKLCIRLFVAYVSLALTLEAAVGLARLCERLEGDSHVCRAAQWFGMWLETPLF